ncbi:MAG: hypothetical protein R3F20_18035 [Planctomycetota bacterium]
MSIRFLALAALLAFASTSAFAQVEPKPTPVKPGVEKPTGDAPVKPDAAKKEVTIPFVGNEKCPLTGEKVNSKYYAEKDGERIYTCCGDCAAKVEADFEAAKKKAYPEDKVVEIKTEKCMIMTRKDVKSNHSVTFQGHKISFCCKRCVKTFKSAPQKYLTLALHPELVDAKNKTCPVMDKEEVDADRFVVYDGFLINLCCKKCQGAFKKDPEKYVEAMGLRKMKAKAKSKDDDDDDDDDDHHERRRKPAAGKPASGDHD